MNLASRKKANKIAVKTAVVQAAATAKIINSSNNLHQKTHLNNNRTLIQVTMKMTDFLKSIKNSHHIAVPELKLNQFQLCHNETLTYQIFRRIY